MNKFKIPTCNCSDCKINEKDEHSDNIIIPKELPTEIQGVLTFEQYLKVATHCRIIINSGDTSFQILLVSFFFCCLFALLFIKFHSNKLELIVISICIFLIMGVGIVLYFIFNNTIQSKLDATIKKFNFEFKAESFRIEKSIKQYSKATTDTTDVTGNNDYVDGENNKVSKLTFIYIIYNIKNNNDREEDGESITNINKISNEIITHKFQNDIISLSLDQNSDTYDTGCREFENDIKMDTIIIMDQLQINNNNNYKTTNNNNIKKNDKLSLI